MKRDPISIHESLQQIAKLIDEGRLTNLRQNYYWRGADVRITDDFEFLRRPRHWLDHDVVICTPHAKEVSWLFCQLRDAFGNRLDFRNKFTFFGELAQRTLHHIENRGSGEDFRPLLRDVLDVGYAVAFGLLENGIIPPNATIVIHHRDASGQQLRFEL